MYVTDRLITLLYLLTCVKVREGSLWLASAATAVGLSPVEVKLCPSSIIWTMVGWLTRELNDAQQLEIKPSITSKYARRR